VGEKVEQGKEFIRAIIIHQKKVTDQISICRNNCGASSERIGGK